MGRITPIIQSTIILVSSSLQSFAQNHCKLYEMVFDQIRVERSTGRVSADTTPENPEVIPDDTTTVAVKIAPVFYINLTILDDDLRELPAELVEYISIPRKKKENFRKIKVDLKNCHFDSKNCYHYFTKSKDSIDWEQFVSCPSVPADIVGKPVLLTPSALFYSANNNVAILKIYSRSGRGRSDSYMYTALLEKRQKKWSIKKIAKHHQ